MEITKRPALDTDMDFARNVHHQAFRDVVVRQFRVWDEKAQDGFFNVGWNAPMYDIILSDGVACGYLCLVEHNDYIHVIDIVLLPVFQGHGIGSSILQQIIERAKVRHVPVKLRVLTASRAIALYQRLGFREYGRTETHVLMEWRDD